MLTGIHYEQNGITFSSSVNQVILENKDLRFKGRNLTERKNVIEASVFNTNKLPYIFKENHISLYIFSYRIEVSLTHLRPVFSLKLGSH